LNESVDMIAALLPVARAFAELDIQYFVGGSVASSFHGATRSTMDVDIIARLEASSVGPFLEKLGQEYYASESAIREAIQQKSCFNLIHFPTAFKIDVFIFKGRKFDHDSLKRAIHGGLDSESGIEFPIASPEDIIISKLEWYQLGNESSERQWQDVVRVMMLLGDTADIVYLKSSAISVKVVGLLQRLLDQVIR